MEDFNSLHEKSSAVFKFEDEYAICVVRDGFTEYFIVYVSPGIFVSVPETPVSRGRSEILSFSSDLFSDSSSFAVLSSFFASFMSFPSAAVFSASSFSSSAIFFCFSDSVRNSSGAIMFTVKEVFGDADFLYENDDEISISVPLKVPETVAGII